MNSHHRHYPPVIHCPHPHHPHYKTNANANQTHPIIISATTRVVVVTPLPPPPLTTTTTTTTKHHPMVIRHSHYTNAPIVICYFVIMPCIHYTSYFTTPNPSPTNVINSGQQLNNKNDFFLHIAKEAHDFVIWVTHTHKSSKYRL